MRAGCVRRALGPLQSPKRPARAFSVAIAAGLIALLPGLAQAQVFGMDGDPGPDSWRSTITAYFWAFNETGTQTIGPFETPVDISFDDWFSNLKIGGSLHYTGRKGQWGVIADAAFLQTEESGIFIREFGRADTLSATYENDSFQGELAATWAPIELKNQTLDFLSGFRYNSQSTDITLDLQIPSASDSIEANQNWVDPIIGAVWPLGIGKDNRWVTGRRADIGGFGVGSQFAFNGGAGIAYRISRLIALDLGFRYQYTNYETGTEGTVDYFQQKTDRYGILGGLGFWF